MSGKTSKLIFHCHVKSLWQMDVAHWVNNVCTPVNVLSGLVTHKRTGTSCCFKFITIQ